MGERVSDTMTGSETAEALTEPHPAPGGDQGDDAEGGEDKIDFHRAPC